MAKSSEILILGDCAYQVSSGILTNKNGEEQTLRSQSAQVLSLLAEDNGIIVLKDSLIRIVWPDRVVTDDSLVQCVSEIRRVIGSDVVQTFPRRGYRLNGVVSSSKPKEFVRAKLPNHLFWLVITLLTITAISTGVYHWTTGRTSQLAAPIIKQQQTLAVLPIRVLGSSESEKYFGDGLGEDIVTDLSKVTGLTVISTASSFAYPNANSGFRAIAEQLGVRYLVRGTIRKNGDRLRINVSLIDANNGSNMWSERFDKPLSDPFGVQEEVAATIAEALSLELQTSSVRPQRIEPGAYFMLQKGLAPLRQFSLEGNKEARHLFLQALALDPEYSRAHASLALTYAQDALLQKLDKSSIEVKDGLESAVASIALDPRSPHGYLALGKLNLAIGETDAALASARHSLEWDKNYTPGYELLAELSLYHGDLREGLVAIQHGKRLHPHYPAKFDWLEGHIRFQLFDAREAYVHLRNASINNPNEIQHLITLAASEVLLGRMSDARTTWNNVLALQPELTTTKASEQIRFLSDDRKSALQRQLQKLNDNL